MLIKIRLTLEPKARLDVLLGSYNVAYKDFSMLNPNLTGVSLKLKFAQHSWRHL